MFLRYLKTHLIHTDHFFFSPAVLTSISLSFINDTITILSASVGQLFTDSPFEEPFAAFAAVDAIMLARCTVPANCAIMFGSAQGGIVYGRRSRSRRRLLWLWLLRLLKDALLVLVHLSIVERGSGGKDDGRIHSSTVEVSQGLVNLHIMGSLLLRLKGQRLA